MALAGLVSGPRMLKIVRAASSRRGPMALRMAGWKTGAKRNAMPTCSMQAAACSAVSCRLTPSAASTSALPHLLEIGAVAVLGHLDAVPGHDKGRRRADVKGAQAVAAGADDVHQHGVADVRTDLHGAALHGAGAACDLVYGLALHAQGGEEGAHLGRRGLALHDLGHRAFGLLGGERAPAKELMNGLLDRSLRHVDISSEKSVPHSAATRSSP